jgi:hypothetical protein
MIVTTLARTITIELYGWVVQVVPSHGHMIMEVLQHRFKLVMQLSHLYDSMVHDLIMNLITKLEVSPHQMCSGKTTERHWDTNLNAHKQDLLSKGLLHTARSRRQGHWIGGPPSKPQTPEVERSWHHRLPWATTLDRERAWTLWMTHAWRQWWVHNVMQAWHGGAHSQRSITTQYRGDGPVARLSSDCKV